jgi:hypothetical protein
VFGNTYSGTTANLQIFSPVCGASSYASFIYPISSASIFSGGLFAACSSANFREECSRKYNMKTTTKKMKAKAIALTLGLILVAGGLYAADQFEGTWKLNESKSKLTPGTDKGTKIVYNSRVIGDELTVTTDGIEGDRTPIHSEWKGKFDGKDYAITGDPDANMCSYQKINDRTLSMTAKKGAEVVLQGLIIVAADGKSQDVFLTSPDAVMSVYNAKAKAKATEKGKEKGFRNKAVYDKE